jgi:hypothetical protein
MLDVFSDSFDLLYQDPLFVCLWSNDRLASRSHVSTLGGITVPLPSSSPSRNDLGEGDGA